MIFNTFGDEMSKESILQKLREQDAQAIELAKEKRFQEAIDLYDEALTLATEHRLDQAIESIAQHFSKTLYDANRYREGIELHEKIISYVMKTDDIGFQAWLYTGLGVFLWFERRFDEALTATLEAKEKSEEAGDNIMLIKALTNLALIETSLDNIEKSLEYYRALFSLADSINAHDDLVNACLNLQAMYFSIDDFDHSMEYGLKGLEIARKRGVNEEISAFINNIGNIYTRRNQHEKALEHYFEGITLLDEEHTRRSWLSNNYLNVGLSYVNLEQYDEGERYLRKAIDIADQQPTQCQESRARAMANLSTVLIHRNQLVEAEKVLSEIIPNLDDLDLGYNRLFFIQSYAEVLAKQNKLSESNNIYRMALDKTVKQYDEKLTKEIARAQTLLDHDMKVREAELLKKQNRELEQKNKELEEAQETIRELERKNTIYAMAVTTNHELNQPLMIIRGNLELLIQGCDVENHSCVRYIDRISSAIDRIEKILTKYRTAERSTMGNYSENTPMVNFEMD